MIVCNLNMVISPIKLRNMHIFYIVHDHDEKANASN